MPWLLLVAETEKEMHHYFIHLEEGRNKNLVAKTCFNRDFQLNVGHPRCLDSLDQGPAFWMLIWTKHDLQSFWSLPIIASNQTTFLHELTDKRPNECSDSTHHFPRGRGKYMTIKSAKCGRDRFTFICNLIFDAQEKKIPFENSTRKRVSNFV